MKYKFRLASSIALAAVSSSLVHAGIYAASSQANVSEAASFYAPIQVYVSGGPRGYYNPGHSYGSWALGPGDLGAFPGNGGYNFTLPQVYLGNAFSNTFGNIRDGGYAHTSGYAWASATNPGSQAGSFLVAYTSKVFYNPVGLGNSFAEVLNTTTASDSFAEEFASNDSAFAEGISAIMLQEHFASGGNSYFLLQASASEAEADAAFGVGTYAGWANYVYGVGTSGSAVFGGFFNSSFASANAGHATGWFLPLASGQTDTVTFLAASFEGATSLYGNSHFNTPGPEAIAPFAIGLLGLMRRRKKA